MEPWMNDELVRSIPKEKLELLSRLHQGSAGKTQREMLSRMVPLIKEARDKGLTFTPAEVSAAIAAIKKHGNAEDNSRIDAILRKTGVRP